MLRGSYAGGSLAVTARCPCATTASVSAYASTAPSSGLSQARPLRHPACPRPGSRRTPPWSPRAHFPCRAAPPPFTAVLLLRVSRQAFAVALQSTAVPSRLIAERLVATPSLSIACDCRAFPSRTLLCSASPLRCRAGLRRRVILHFKAVARQISEELCLRLALPCLALLRFALAMHCFALPSPGHAPQSNAFAARIGPSPLHAAALLRHNGAVRHLAIAARCVTRLCRRHSIRSPSQLGCSTPLRIGSLPVMAELPNASAYRSVAGHSRVRAFPCPSFAAPSFAALVLRRSRLSRAFPSRRRAKQISSFAALGLAGLLRRRAARRCALLFHHLPEQIKALPLQRPSPQRHRDARPSHANPLPPTSSLCRRISLKASLRCSVAPPHNATQIHRRTMPLMALPPRIIATLR